VYGVAAGPATSYQVLVVETAGAEPQARAVGSEHRDRIPQAYVPELVRRTFDGPDGRKLHANVYAPRNPDFLGPSRELPPYVVWAHGGPTMRPPIALNLEIAYFTSRGIGVVEIDYAGTPGYGQAHLQRLRGQWGVVDVEDCAAVATALVEEGTAAQGRLAIRGGSAGGFTSAASIVATDVYACAYLYCPVLDLELFAAGGTHDFEAHYLDTLLGPVDGFRDRYRDRSPINHPDLITVPFLITQGTADPICPPEQSEALLAAMAGRGVPHAALMFEGEGHGFRRQDSLVASLEAELGLYARVFGFETPGVPELELKD
jgi:dipeptidyl aminopeptidase/acylaminoacyl peptidase